MKTLLMVVCLLGLCAAPAMANDLMDWVQSPGSETLSLGDALLAFAGDALGTPDGLALGVVNGELSDAFYIGVDETWEGETGVESIPTLALAGMLGVTLGVEDPEAPDVQWVGGIGVKIVNLKGGELWWGIQLVSNDISKRALDLGALGRVHYAEKIEYRVPLGG